jgi:hypothetical protein
LTDTGTGLPDGLFSNQKSKFGFILEALVMEEVAMFYGHLVRFTVFCYILWTFGVVRGILVYFSVLVFRTKKNLATLPVPAKTKYLSAAPKTVSPDSQD